MKQKTRLTAVHFRSDLRKAGFKATHARITLLSLLQREKHPLSSRDIIEKMEKIADPVTVYRMLKCLTEAGLVRHLDFQHGHAHYELADGDDHHHLICIKCGATEDIEGCKAESMGKYIIHHSKKFREIKRHSLEFFGICNKCHTA